MSGLHAMFPRSTELTCARSHSSCLLTYTSRELKHFPAHTHTPQPVEGPATLSVRMQSTKTTFTFSPDSALIPIITEDLCGGVPCSLQGATTFQGKFLYSCCAASEGTAAHSTGLLLRNGRKLKCRKLK